MSVIDSFLSKRLKGSRRSPRAWGRAALMGTAATALSLAMISACGGGSTTGGDNNTGGTSGGNNNGSSNTNNNHSSNGNNTGGNNTGANNNSSGGNNTGANNNSSGGNNTGANNNSSNGNTGSGGSSSGGGITDAGTLADGAPACTNTSTSTINIDSSGFACDNQWNIQGAWYCFADSNQSSCTGTGDIPYDSGQSAMCINGTTGASAGSATNYGAGIGLVLNADGRGVDAGKNTFNPSTQNIVGFAITISGDTGGAVLDVTFPTPAFNNAEAPSVTIPGVSGTAVTYNVLFKDALITDATKVPPTFDPTMLTDVQVEVAGGDGIAHKYNYCVTKIVPLTAAPSGPATTMGNYGPSWTEGKQVVLEGLGPYGIQNDVTTVGSQMAMQATYSGGSMIGFSATPSSFSGGGVGAYPAIVYGWVHGGSFVGANDTGGYKGGSTISSLSGKTIASSWSFTPSNNNNYDAAYDCWFAQAQAPINAGLELMVWLDEKGVQPIGSDQNKSVTGSDGAKYEVWTGQVSDSNGSHGVISYVRSSSTTSSTGLNLNTFFQDSTGETIPNSNGYSSSWYLLSIQAGFELYGSGTWTTSSYSVSIQ